MYCSFQEQKEAVSNDHAWCYIQGLAYLRLYTEETTG